MGPVTQLTTDTDAETLTAPVKQLAQARLETIPLGTKVH